MKHLKIGHNGETPTERLVGFVKKPLRKSKNNDILKETIYEAISRKPKGHDFIIDRKKEESFVRRHMNVTGG